MTEIKIDKGVPITQSHYSRGTRKYPLHLMEVGDSYMVTIDAEDAVKLSSARTSPCTYGLRHNKKFVTRKVEGGVRVWRTK